MNTLVSTHVTLRLPAVLGPSGDALAEGAARCLRGDSYLVPAAVIRPAEDGVLLLELTVEADRDDWTVSGVLGGVRLAVATALAEVLGLDPAYASPNTWGANLSIVLAPVG